MDQKVYWVMRWDQTRFPDKPPYELQFELELALAHLLQLKHMWRRVE